MATENMNTPTQGLTLDAAFAQLKASRGAAPEEREQLDELDGVDVVEEGLDEEELDAEETDEYEEESEGDDLDEESEDAEGSEDGDVPDVFEIEIDGEMVEVTADELHKGYLRHNDYTRKRQADAKKAKELETEYQTKLSKLDEALTVSMAQDERQLAQAQREYQGAKDEASRRNAHYKILQLQTQIQARKQAQQQAATLREQTMAAQQEAYWAEQEEMLRSRYENWDEKKVELKSYLESQGFEDLSMFAHADMASIVDKAKQFDELQQKRKGVASKKIRRKVGAVLKPGAGEKKFSQNKHEIARLEAQFAKTRSIKDAHALARARKRGA